MQDGIPRSIRMIGNNANDGNEDQPGPANHLVVVVQSDAEARSLIPSGRRPVWRLGHAHTGLAFGARPLNC